MKTPKEEAEEIVEKFLSYAHTHYDELNGFDFRSGKESAIKIAIIHVEGILKEVWKDDYESRNYWNQILTELKKM